MILHPGRQAVLKYPLSDGKNPNDRAKKQVTEKKTYHKIIHWKLLRFFHGWTKERVIVESLIRLAGPAPDRTTP